MLKDLKNEVESLTKKKKKKKNSNNISLEKKLAESQSKLTELTNDYVGGVFGDSEDENMQK